MSRESEYICHRRRMYVVEGDLFPVEVNVCRERIVYALGDVFVSRIRRILCHERRTYALEGFVP